MFKRGFWLLPAAALALAPFLAGCAGEASSSAYSSVLEGSAPHARGDLGTLTYRAVDQIVEGAPILSANTPMVVSSISNVEDLDGSSPLGNIVADLVRARLVQKGLFVSDLRVRSSVLMRPREGEMMLSRQARSVVGAIDAAAIVTGTYAVANETVIVSLKVMAASGSRIISAADYVVPLTGLQEMLRRHGAKA